MVRIEKEFRHSGLKAGGEIASCEHEALVLSLIPGDAHLAVLQGLVCNVGDKLLCGQRNGPCAEQFQLWKITADAVTKIKKVRGFPTN